MAVTDYDGYFCNMWRVTPVSIMIPGIRGSGATRNQLSSTGLSQITWTAGSLPASVKEQQSGTTHTAVYDALGHAVESNATAKTLFLYGASGAKLAKLTGGTLTAAMVPLTGGETAVYNASGLQYMRHTDWLGSSRLATTWAHAVYSKESYAPFGETYNEFGTADRSFTGQEQDTVTGNLGSGTYDFPARSYDPAAGRWLSPDPLGWGAANIYDPQSLDRYAYVENQPMNAVDPTGLCEVVTTSFYGFVSVGYKEDGNLPCVYLTAPTQSPCAIYGDCGNGDQNTQGGSSGNAGGGGGNSGSNKYVCMASALGSGILSVGVDALGFIPGEKDVEAGVKVGAGTMARQIGNLKGYSGIVADRYGAKFIASQSQNLMYAGAGYGIGNGAGTGDWIGAGLSAAGLIPGLNEFAAAASIGYDAYKTAKAVSKCQ